MNIPFLGKKIKWYNMSDLNETELKNNSSESEILYR